MLETKLYSKSKKLKKKILSELFSKAFKKMLIEPGMA